MSRWICLFAVLTVSLPVLAQEIHLNEAGARKVGQKIWENECDGTVSGLTSWNSGEAFASLGIGHFIWYPEGKTGPFHESFPDLILLFNKNKVSLPSWLSPKMGCPWKTKAEFEAAKDSARMVELRTLLKSTIALQTQFLIQRLASALPKMLEAAPTSERSEIRTRFYSLGSSPAGAYALIDYVNFKGEGVAPGERYKGEGWGLLQVLEGMKGTDVQAFAASAKRVLTRRVENSPPDRGETRWLPGWKNRLDTYVSF